MLSTITPLAERARGRRYGLTAMWFVAGSVVGGAMTGAAAAGLAAGWRGLSASVATRLAVGAGAAGLAVLIDVGRLGPRIPHHRRQVNEQWLEQFRSWVYGAGFGLQIGTGLATYIMTAGVYLWIVLASLTASPRAALVVGVAFGLVRGLAILLTARVQSPQALMSIHERFERRREPVRRLVIAVEVAALVLCLVGSSAPIALSVAAGVLATGLWWTDRQLLLPPTSSAASEAATGSNARAREFMQ